MPDSCYLQQNLIFQTPSPCEEAELLAANLVSSADQQQQQQLAVLDSSNSNTTTTAESKTSTTPDLLKFADAKVVKSIILSCK